MLSRRAFLVSVSVLALATPASAWIHGSAGLPIPANVWMETPDILAFTVDDSALNRGNTITLGSPSGQPYNAAFQSTNPVTGNNEYGFVIGPDKTEVHFVDLPSTTFVDKVALRDVSKYSITNGVTVTAVYYRDAMIDPGTNYVGSSISLLSSFRHTVYLKLSAPLANGTTYTVSNSSAPFPNFSFTYNDKRMRAGGLKVTQVGVRGDDAFKKAYLCSRVPGMGTGVVDFASTYGVTEVKVLNASLAVVDTLPVTLRFAWNTLESGDYPSYASNGFDVADLSVGYPITAITKGNPTSVTCPGHPFSNGDKARLHGIYTVTGLDGVGQTGNVSSSNWIAGTVTVVDADNFTININSSGMSGTFTTTPTYSEALGGVASVAHKCFNTNRAGTNVYEIDFSAFTTEGTFYLYIPGYGVSDPINIGTGSYATLAGYFHEGLYNMRLGCDVNRSVGWDRPLASVDGVNSCAIYQSLLPAPFSSESQSPITPSGAPTIFASGMGGYSEEGTFAIASLSWSANVVTATTVSPHGLPNGSYPIRVVGASPSGYNFTPTVSGGVATFATVTGANTFTYPRSGDPGANTVPGTGLTGFLTSTRLTGYRASTQDAGDNDDLLSDHAIKMSELAFTFNNIPAASRFTPFSVQTCTDLLDPTLYAGTDSLPPLFAEICWYADNYRVRQAVDGSVDGGVGLPKFSSQIPGWPEPIQLNHGVDPLGNRAGQTCMNFAYAAEHWSTMQYAVLAAQIALICQGYSLTTLSNTWRNSAIAARNWALSMMGDLTARDAYYISTLNLQAKMGWTTAQYNDAMSTLNSRAQTQLYNTDAALYRLIGSPSNQSPYGDFIEGKGLNGTPTINSGGSGYAVGDLVVLAGGTLVTGGQAAIVRITGASGGVVTSVATYFPGQYTSGSSQPTTQASTTGSGTGLTFTASGIFGVTYAAFSAIQGAYDYAVTPSNNATAATYLLGHLNGNSTANANLALGSTICFNCMTEASAGGNPNSGNLPVQTNQNIVAHLAAVYQSSIAAQANSIYLKSMQAHLQWMTGANLPGKCMIVRRGIRYVESILHEDQYAMGVPPPPGIVPFGYAGWATGQNGLFSFGLGASVDSSLAYIGNNISGVNQGLIQPGSTKQWTPWQFGESYWEYQPEVRAQISISEWTLNTQSNIIATALYLHGWDGNT